MLYGFIFWTLMAVFSPIDGQTCNAPDNCRQLEFVPEHNFDGKRLGHHVIRTVDVIGEGSCRTLCYLEANCVSYNFKKAASENGKYKCELNNSTFEGQKGKLEKKTYYIYQGAKNACMKKPCQNKATCQTGFTDKGYRCLCTAGFIGKHCEKGCGDGVWTPVMKMDGNKQTFHYNSTLWSNKETLNLDGGKTGFDSQESKLPSYWNTPFSKICLSMKIGQQIKFIVIDKKVNSLYSLIADGQYRATSLGRDTWKSLIGSEASLQRYCNKEGFNVITPYSRLSKARIGILGNEEDNCFRPDSRIGFGTGGDGDDKNTCGNEAKYLPDNGDKNIKGMGYILVQ